MFGGIDMKGKWWKILSVLLILYSIIAGFTIHVPDLGNLHESIRIIFFHVCMWFVMIVMLGVSAVNSIRYLLSANKKHDIIAAESVNIAVVFGMLGIITGAVWAKFVWGQWWMNDPKLNGAAVGLIAYFAYIILRSSIPDAIKRARISAVYNILSFVLFILFILILPKLSTGSIHPGDGNDSGMPVFTLDSSMSAVFFPAILGWILFSIWILNVRVRISNIKNN
jgi:heme exporter protein C